MKSFMQAMGCRCMKATRPGPAFQRFLAKAAGAGKSNSKKGNVENKKVRTCKEEASSGAEATRGSVEQATKVPWVLFGLGGMFVYGVGAYGAMLYFGSGGADSTCSCGHIVSEADRRRAYDMGAKTYENDVCAGEAWFGIYALRKSLLAKAQGDVLEVAVGTGHNFSLYPSSCTVTATDASANMVQIARQRQLQPTVKVVEVMDVEALRFPARSFDTVVDTYGLCSYEDPVLALREMTRVCKSEEDGGRLLLLEHGRSWLWPVNFFLDRSAPQHACKWGCWWNRDIPGIIRSSGGLKIIEMETYHCGTTLVVVAVPQQAQTDAGSK